MSLLRTTIQSHTFTLSCMHIGQGQQTLLQHLDAHVPVTVAIMPPFSAKNGLYSAAAQFKPLTRH
jgi:hypothetical protein